MSKNKFGKKLFKKIGTIGLAITGALLRRKNRRRPGS